MAHSAVWGHLPIRRQNTNCYSKKLTIKKLSKSGLRRFIKFSQAHSNDERKITLSLNLHFIWDLRVTSSAENIDLARKKLGPKEKICTIKNVLFNNFYHLAKKLGR